ncbi:hypothetical protein ABT186_06410 [Streptomyces sp. NPDC001634]|uniref:hypothetical protein n=1 Tax=Streptomyces sp. NPDC001634 TaxID=3154390 RepID=UPI00332225B7
MTSETTTTEITTTVHGASRPLRLRPVGRHRKPRRRRMVLAVGGFALAAGALSLVHIAPESVTGGGGTAEAEPRIDPTDTAATVATVPSTHAAYRSTTAIAKEASGILAATATASPPAPPSAPSSASAPRVTDPATGIPEAPSTPTASRTPAPPAAAAPTAPRPTTSPTEPAHTPTPAPNPPGLCVPLVGLCVNGL